MKIALAQMNPIVGDFDYNSAKILDYIADAHKKGAELVIFPELSLLGYPPKDLLLKPDFVDQNIITLEMIVREMPAGITAMVGCAMRSKSVTGKPLHNSMAVISRGEILSVHHKTLLPNYDVFDEHRYFEPSPEIKLASVGGKKIGVSICEDMWTIEDVVGHKLYDRDPIAEMASGGAEFLVNIAASPYVIWKNRVRNKLLCAHAKRYKLPLVYVNQVGGNDELLFGGASSVHGPDGELIARCKSFEEQLMIVDLANPKANCVEPMPEGLESVRPALVLGLRDYVRKCGFTKGVVIGLSGGIDSALVAAIAVEALGPDMVHGVAMPSRFNAAESLTDAQDLAKNLGIACSVISIEKLRGVFDEALSESFDGLGPDVTEENIQARIRGTLLMSYSNKFGYLLLSTGNKSELAMGYCTLYGDMAGGFALISDVPKMMVYDLARLINREREIIPENTIVKPPSAELRPDQVDQDSLPPYEILDEILRCYIEEENSAEQIIADGFDAEVVKKVIVTVDRNEYKRKQAAVGVKVTSRAFGSGRRVPIAQKFKQRFSFSADKK